MNYLKLDEPIPYQGSFVNAVRIDFVGKLTLDMVEPQFTLGIANFDEAGELTGFLEVAGHTPRISGGPFDKRRGALLMAVIKDIFGALEDYQDDITTRKDEEIQQVVDGNAATEKANSELADGEVPKALAPVPVKQLREHPMGGQLVIDASTQAMMA